MGNDIMSYTCRLWSSPAVCPNSCIMYAGMYKYNSFLLFVVPASPGMFVHSYFVPELLGGFSKYSVCLSRCG